ncbi:MAG: hypothetical protein RJB38_1366 [Pseudomonadota bacterium]|jgi:triosephosphate isomerase
MNASRGIVVAGNWKMNHGPHAARSFIEELAALGFPGAKAKQSIEAKTLRLRLFAPSLSVSATQAAIENLGKSETSRNPWIEVGVQNAHFERSGAFTGEISGPLLLECGIRTVLIGHSERRQHFGETNTSAGQRMASLLDQGFEVVFCVGETRAEREAGKTEAVLAKQLDEAFLATQAFLKAKNRSLTPELWNSLVIAYEPVWAIGTGLTATPEQAQEAHAQVRHWFRSQKQKCEFPLPDADRISLLYGGSVTPENFARLLECPDVDGALVGGASLQATSFLKLIEIGAQAI